MATYTLNKDAVKHAQKLIDEGKVDLDTAWSEEKPSAADGNAEIERHGYAAYGLWFLAVEPDASEDTKERYHFPYGDFSKVSRQGLIHAEQRAAQNDHDDVAKAAKQLLEHLDAQRSD